jgi:uncharacterized protein (TIGR02284 family)
MPLDDLTAGRPAASQDQTDLLVCLNELIALCYNGEKGYAVACTRVEAPLLRTHLAAYVEQRAGFAEALRAEVEGLGGAAETSGDIAGAAHRLWIRLKYVVRPADAGVIAECLLGDTAALEVYEEVRQKQLPQSVQKVVEQQYEAIRAARDRLRALQRSSRQAGLNGQR